MISLILLVEFIEDLDAAGWTDVRFSERNRPPRSQVSQATSMLANEYGTASNIKSRVNRLSVLAAITSTQQRLKLYNRVPTNGLVVYCGTILTVRADCTYNEDPTDVYACRTKAKKRRSTSISSHSNPSTPLFISVTINSIPKLCQNCWKAMQSSASLLWTVTVLFSVLWLVILEKSFTR